MSGGQYVALAYAIVFVTLLAYVAIIAAKLVRLQREVGQLLALARRRQPEAEPAREVTRA